MGTNEAKTGRCQWCSATRELPSGFNSGKFSCGDFNLECSKCRYCAKQLGDETRGRGLPASLGATTEQRLHSENTVEKVW